MVVPGRQPRDPRTLRAHLTPGGVATLFPEVRGIRGVMPAFENTDELVGDIAVARKKGREYIWVRHADAAAEMLLKRPIAACVEKAYEEGKFAGFGIGA